MNLSRFSNPILHRIFIIQDIQSIFDFLGPAASNWTYWDPSKVSKVAETDSTKGYSKGRNRKCLPIDEFFMVMIRL